MEKLPLLISVPHGGDKVPPELKNKTNLSRKDIFEDGDALTREIYNFSDQVEALVETKIARACIDLNRSPLDRAPENPDGVIKTVTTMNRSVYKNNSFPDDILIEYLLEKYYFPYHKQITCSLRSNKIKLCLDCHSMLSFSPNVSTNPGQERPLICLSNRGDELGKPVNGIRTATCPTDWIKNLASCFMTVFKISSADVKLNNPFSGGYITKFHSHQKHWIQIEMNRRLYLSSPFFNNQSLKVSIERIAELNDNLFQVIDMFCKKMNL